MAGGTTLRRLAAEGSLENDDALLRVWDAGLSEVEDIDQVLNITQAARIRDALGLPSVREMRSVAYWLAVLEMTRAEFAEMLSTELDIRLADGARKLPKGALARLRRHSLPPQAMDSARRPEELRASDEGRLRGTGGIPQLEWRVIGREGLPVYLEVDEVLRVHDVLTAEFAQTDDPIDPPGLRDIGLLESAVYRCQTALGDEPKYPTVEMSTAALLYGVAHNHAFHNGNKRTALVSMLSMLDRNGLVLTCSQEQLFKFMLRFAQHQFSPTPGSPQADWETIAAAEWILANSRLIEKGEKPLKWRELKQRLRRFGVEWESTNVGNRIKLTREVTRSRNWFGGTVTDKLVCPTHYADDGRTVERNQLNQIRSELQLTETFGVDSAAFYASETEIDDFIANYRKILLRLAKL